jgi:hypothetical protein
MRRKITRILVKTGAYLLLLLVVLCITVFFAVKSHSFQTWLAHKAGTYMSKELQAEVRIEKVTLDFFTNATLEGIFVSDRKKDTLFSGNISVDITNFDFGKKILKLDKTVLKDMTVKLMKYKGDSTLNFQFLADYFSKENTSDTTVKQNWQIEPGDIYIENMSFLYRDHNKEKVTGDQMDFNDIELRRVNTRINNLSLGEETFYANVHDLSCIDRSGFELTRFSAKAGISYRELDLKRLYLKTPNTILRGKINFRYNDWGDYSDFLDKIRMDCQLENTTINFKDIAYFTKELDGFEEKVYLSGKIKGYVTDINLKEFELKYRENTGFKGNLSLTGLPDITTGFLRVDATALSINYNDLVQFPNYPFNSGKKLELPPQVKALGTATYKGKFNGFLNDFAAKGNFYTALGNIGADLFVRLGDKPDDTQYKGKINTENFNVGVIAGIKGLTNLSFSGEVKGKGLSLGAVDTKLSGHVAALTYNNYAYHNVSLDGVFRGKVFSGLLSSKDPNASIDFDGKMSFKNKIPEMDFISTINKIDLQALHFSNEKAILSSQALIVIKGDSPNNLTGDINFDNTIFKNKKGDFKLSTFDLLLDQENIDKKITLTSAYFNFEAAGRFEITNLGTAFNNFLSVYYPAFINPIKTKTPLTDAFKFTLKIKKFNTIRDLVIPSLMVSPGTTFGGDFDITKNLFNINLKSDSLKLAGVSFNKSTIESFSSNNKINIVFKANDIQLTDSIKLENYFSYFVSKDKDTKFNFEWDNKASPKVAGKLFGKATFENKNATVNFEKFFVTARDSTWNLTTINPTVIDSSGALIVNPLLFTSNHQAIGIAGALSKKVGDSLMINTANVVLQQFNPILKAFGLDLQGDMNGSVSLYNSDGFAFGSDLAFNKFNINKNFLGKLSLKTNYNPKQKNIQMNGFTSVGIRDAEGNETKNISFNGFYYMDDREETIDISFRASPANLKLLNPMMAGIMTINNGLVMGNGRVHGKPSNIKLDGKLKLFNSDIKIDYTNVNYNITGDIEIMPDQIRFVDLQMKEIGAKAAPQGTINGNIFHSNFTKMQLDYDVTYRNMLVLNTTERENKTFYGKVYGSGRIGIWGFLNDLHMQVIDTTNRGSKFYLPLDGPAEVEENDFIRFVKRDTVKAVEEKLTGFNLEMYVHTTPDLQAQIILDKRTGDILNVEGKGDLNLNISTLGKFEMIGDYIMTDGDYRFTLENVINKKFDIDAGSSISWSGDPLGAEIDIITSYRQRASVAPLLNDTSGNYKGRVPVDVKLKISDKLFSPNIKFNIDFPSIDATARARIENLLNDEMELNRQVFSFLLFRSFVTPQIYNASGGGVTAGNAAASTGSEMLSNQVSNFLNSYVGNLTGMGDLNLGLNYRTGTQTSGDAVDLALSKQLFNNKVSIDGNFGVNNNSSSASGKNSSGIIDVNIEYKLTDDGRYRLKGFNRSNNSTQITTTGGPFTQGIGLFYREEFETFNELFKRYLQKVKKKEAAKAEAAAAGS